MIHPDTERRMADRMNPRSTVELDASHHTRREHLRASITMLATTHEPPGYECPFCKLASGEDTAYNCQADIVRRTPEAMALISPRWWPRNQGHVLVVPLGHYENLYLLPTVPGHAVHDLVHEVAIAIRQTYGCQGVSTRQHNEPAGNQDAWHYHVHVFPRYVGDQLYASAPLPDFVTAEQRGPYADKLRSYFDTAVTAVSEVTHPPSYAGCSCGHPVEPRPRQGR